MVGIATALVAIAISVSYLLLIPSQVPALSSPFGVTSQTIPYLAGTLGLAFGGALLARGLIWRNRASDDGIPVQADPESRAGYGRLVLALVVFIGYLMVLPIAGYLLSTAVTVFVLMLLVSRDRLVLKAVLGSATAVVLFVLFAELLNIRLPTPLVRGVL